MEEMEKRNYEALAGLFSDTERLPATAPVQAAVTPTSTHNTILVMMTPSLFHPVPTSFLILQFRGLPSKNPLNWKPKSLI